MRAIPFSSAVRTDKTFAVVLSLIVLLGIVEFGAVVLHYATKTRSPSRAAAAGPAASKTSAKSTPKIKIPAKTPDKVGPATAAAALSHPAPSPAARLLQQARKFRERGDTANALARLQQAAQLESKNAEVLAEMAMIYESIQLFDRSNETWQRLQALGSSVGPLYELADMKLKMGVPTATPASAQSGNSIFGAGGIPDGSAFGITEVTATQTPDPEADMHMMLRVAVKARSNTPVDYTKVKIQVFFYDIVDNDRVVLTDADVSYEWLTPHHNWKEANPEVLAVTYLRAKHDALSSDANLTAVASEVMPPVPGKHARPTKQPLSSLDPTGGGQRKYLGYIVRVYYKDQLQAVRAEPNRLLSLFPPPFTAPTE